MMFRAKLTRVMIALLGLLAADFFIVPPPAAQTLLIQPFDAAGADAQPLLLQTQNTATAPVPAPASVATLKQLYAYLDHCLHGVSGPPGAQLTIAFALKRDGSLLGLPHVAFLRASRDSERAVFLDAVAEKFSSCLPAPISDGLGGAVAGRRLTLRFVTPSGPERAL